MALTFAVGLSLFGAMYFKMFRYRAQPFEQDARFLRDFAALFGLLYFVCPPNALGVIGIDMRILQLALYPALFLFARRESLVLRAVCVPLVLLLGTSLYQFAASQKKAEIEVSDTRMPPQLGAFGAVDPTSIADEYDRLRTGKQEGFIWTTGIYSQTTAWKRIRTVGR